MKKWTGIIWETGRRLTVLSCVLGCVFIAQLFLPLPLTFAFGDFNGPWGISREERAGRRDFHLRTPFLEFGHTWGDSHPFCGRYPTGWFHTQKSLAFVSEGYGVYLRALD